MDFIRKELYEPEENYTNKIIDTEFFIKRKRDFGLCYSELSNSLNDIQNKKLAELKLLVYQLLHEASAENFARGFRCAVRLFCDSMSNDNDGMPEPLDNY